MAHTPHRRVILDMDSSESPVHGQQEGAAYNGHFECVCYHPLFLFNQFGDCEGATLRPGNVHSADGWQELLELVVKGYQKKGLRLLFRGDAAKGADRTTDLCRSQARTVSGGHRDPFPSPGAGPPAHSKPCRLRWGLASGECHCLRRAGHGDKRLPRGLASHPGRGLPARFRDRKGSTGCAAGRSRYRTGSAPLGRGRGKGFGTGERPAARLVGTHLSPGAGHCPIRRIFLHFHRGRGAAGILGHPRAGR